MTNTISPHTPTWTKATRWLVASVISSLVCGVAGYYLHSLLSRDRILIEDVGLLARKQALAFNLKDFITIDECTSNTRIGRYTSLPVSYRSGTVAEGHEEEMVEFLHHVQLLFGLFVERFQADPSWDEEDQLFAKECMETVDRAVNAASNWGALKTGELELLVTFLNTGDTDGLIRVKGAVDVEGIQEDLSLRLAQDYQALPPSAVGERSSSSIAAVPVKKRSIEMVRFVVSRSTSPSAAYKNLENRVKRGQTISYTVIFHDIRGSKVTWEAKEVQPQ